MFYNTTKEEGELLTKYKKSAVTQDEKILALFKKYPDNHFTPNEIWRAMFTGNTPLTSIRRAINTLTNKGFLTKLPEKQIEQYGRPTHKWGFAERK